MEDQARELEALDRLLVNTSDEVPTMLSYAVIKSITENFSKRVGRGGFGEVFLGTLPNGKVAVKKLLTSLDIDDKLFVDEVSCLKRVKHKNIVRFLGYCADTRNEVMEVNGRCVMVDAVRQRLLCFEYVPYGGLDNYLKDNVYGSDWHTRCKIIKGICLGLQYLHKQNITHLDLKPENVLLDADMEPKITDFGLSRCFDDKQSRIVTENIRGTLGYMAPELLKGGEISFKTDIYSLGVIMRKLSECNIHSNDNSNKSLDVECIPTKKLIEIAQSCVDTEQRNRPTIDKIIDEIETIIKTMPAPAKKESRNVPGSPMCQINQFASRELIHVHPRKLCYQLGQNKRKLSSLQLTNRTDDLVAFMMINSSEASYTTPSVKGFILPRSTWGIVLEFQGGEQAAQKMQWKDMILVRSTIVKHGLNYNDITYDLFNKQTFVHDVELDIFFDVPARPRSLLHEFDKLQLGAATNQACAESIKTELLDIYPFELRFTFQPNIMINGTINLTNKTDDGISYWIIPNNPRMYQQLATSFCCTGTLSARSTCAVTLTIKSETKPTHDAIEILMAPSSTLRHQDLARISNYGELKRCFDETVREKGCKAHVVYIFSVINDPDPANTVPLPIEGVLTENFGEITSMDVDPTKARILTGHARHICIWKRNEQAAGYALEKSLKYLSHTGMGSVTRFLATMIARVSVVKFAARKQWVLSGDSAGFIDVYTTELAVLVVRFKAHSSGVRSLAVHPSHPYVLSSSDDHLIKLWDWDRGWMCTRVFRGHSNPVVQVAFDKNDTNTFASVCSFSHVEPGNLKTWNLHSAVPKTDLEGSFKAVDYGLTVNDRPYITILSGGGIEIWDPQATRCVHTYLDFWNCDINVVVCHPTLPLIFTGTNNGHFCIWNLTTFRREFMCSFAFGGVIGFGFINTTSYKRLVIGYANRVIFLDIDLQSLAAQ